MRLSRENNGAYYAVARLIPLRIRRGWYCSFTIVTPWRCASARLTLQTDVSIICRCRWPTAYCTALVTWDIWAVCGCTSSLGLGHRLTYSKLKQTDIVNSNKITKTLNLSTQRTVVGYTYIKSCRGTLHFCSLFLEIETKLGYFDSLQLTRRHYND